MMEKFTRRPQKYKSEEASIVHRRGSRDKETDEAKGDVEI